jgi:hypothetical protein
MEVWPLNLGFVNKYLLRISEIFAITHLPVPARFPEISTAGAKGIPRA